MTEVLYAGPLTADGNAPQDYAAPPKQVAYNGPLTRLVPLVPVSKDPGYVPAGLPGPAPDDLAPLLDWDISKINIDPPPEVIGTGLLQGQNDAAVTVAPLSDVLRGSTIGDEGPINEAYLTSPAVKLLAGQVFVLLSPVFVPAGGKLYLNNATINRNLIVLGPGAVIVDDGPPVPQVAAPNAPGSTVSQVVTGTTPVPVPGPPQPLVPNSTYQVTGRLYLEPAAPFQGAVTLTIAAASATTVVLAFTETAVPLNAATPPLTTGAGEVVTSTAGIFTTAPFTADGVRIIDITGVVITGTQPGTFAIMAAETVAGAQFNVLAGSSMEVQRTS